MGRVVLLQAFDPGSGRSLGPARLRSERQRTGVPPQVEEAFASAATRTFNTDPYPADGTVDAVLAWVGYDPERAKAAIAAEHGRGKPRKTLLRELSERTG